MAGEGGLSAKTGPIEITLLQLIRFSILNWMSVPGSHTVCGPGLGRQPSFFSLFSGTAPRPLETPDFINTSQFLCYLAVKLKRHLTMMLSMLPVSTFLVLCLISLGPVHAQNTTRPPLVVPTPPGPYATRMEIKVLWIHPIPTLTTSLLLRERSLSNVNND